MAGKAEVCGDSKAVLLYTVLSSNHPMARAFPKCTLVMVWAWTHKTTTPIIIIVTINYNIGFTCTICQNVRSVHKGFTV